MSRSTGVGQRLIEARGKLGSAPGKPLPQDEFAAFLGVSTRQYRRWETNGKLGRLADQVGQRLGSLDWLLSGKGRPPDWEQLRRTITRSAWTGTVNEPSTTVQRGTTRGPERALRDNRPQTIEEALAMLAERVPEAIGKALKINEIDKTRDGRQFVIAWLERTADEFQREAGADVSDLYRVILALKDGRI